MNYNYKPRICNMANLALEGSYNAIIKVGKSENDVGISLER